MEKKQGTSIRFQLILLLTYCLLMPVILISSICAMYIRSSVMDRTLGMLRSSSAYAAQMTGQRMDAVIQEMRAVISGGELAKYFQDYRSSGDVQSFAYNVRSALSQQFRLRPGYLFAGACFDGNAERLITTSLHGNSYADRYYKDVHRQILDALSPEDNSAHFYIRGNDIYLYQNLLDNRTLDYYGMIVIQLDPDYVFEFFEDLDPFPECAMLQLNDQVFWLRTFQGGKPLPDLAPISRKTPSDVKQEGEYLTALSYEKRDTYRFGYRLLTSGSDLQRQVYMVLLLAGLIALVSALPLGIVLVRIYRGITGPIDALTAATKRIEQEKYHTEISNRWTNEFGQLIQSFNKMSAKIRYLFDFAYRERIAAGESRIMMLESQMNPHFLNNTLELINWKARLSGNEDISRMIEELGNLLDASLDRGNTRVVPLEKELGYMKSYLYIIGQRFGKRLSIQQHIDDRLMDSMVPRLIIQPLIENAVVHGIEPGGGGHIDIQVGRLGKKIGIEIINDGVGLTEEDLRKIEGILSDNSENLSGKQRRLGVKNVQERLRLMYGDSASLAIKRLPDGRTVSRIWFPETLDEPQKWKEEELQ